jgi:glycosyltransferase A (GT-A) superfamily protein (DUF2064 family)
MDIRHSGHTALVLFTRTREEEARIKDFSATHSIHTNSLIAGHLIGHAEQTARNTGLPCFVISSAQQHGDSFGEKLAHAFEDIYALGYEQVIAIGNDCPTLTTHDLLQAADALEVNGAVIGPAADGGVYLIGMQRDQFSHTHFTALPWSSANLSEALQVYFQTAGMHFFTCRELSDIDFSASLKQMLHGAQVYISLRTTLLSLLASVHAGTSTLFTNPELPAIRISCGLRAPPAW